MAINKISQSGHISYGVSEFIIDTDADVINLPIDITKGSSALSLSSGNVYFLNGERRWVLVGGDN